MDPQKEIWNNIYKNESSKWNKENLALPKRLHSKKVLEIGVGNGKTLKAILRQGPKEVIAIDTSKEAIKLCKKNIKRKNVILNRSDIKNLKASDEYFDAVVCYYTLNNLIKKDRKRAISEIFRVLKKKGIMLFDDFSKGDLREKKQLKRVEKGTILKNNGLICHFFSKLELKALFNNFSGIKIC